MLTVNVRKPGKFVDYLNRFAEGEVPKIIQRAVEEEMARTLRPGNRVTLRRPGEGLHRVRVFKYGIEYQDGGRLEGAFEILLEEGDTHSIDWVADAFRGQDSLVLEASSGYAGTISGDCIISEMAVDCDARRSTVVRFKIVGKVRR